MTSNRLYELQLSNGGFESVVISHQARRFDSNGFTVALVLRATRNVTADAALTMVRKRALSFIARCASSEVPGAFAFWPDDARPPWAPQIPADIDDTAIMVTELLRHGRLDTNDALRRVCRAMLPYRVSEKEAATLPPWIVPGCFYTWISAGLKPPVNVVDCCVNANVIALMAILRAEHLPGYTAAIQTIRKAVEWAGNNQRKLETTTPFYPCLESLLDALEHAIECGALALREVSNRLEDLFPRVRNRAAGCCSSAYGSTVWNCEAVDVARALAETKGRTTRTPSPVLWHNPGGSSA